MRYKPCIKKVEIFMCDFLVINFILMVFSTHTLFLIKMQECRITKINISNQGPVVQSIVILTTSLRRQFVKYMPTALTNPLLFFVEKM